MNADIKGRILAHIMFEELEKIAAKVPFSRIKNIFKVAPTSSPIRTPMIKNTVKGGQNLSIPGSLATLVSKIDSPVAASAAKGAKNVKINPMTGKPFTPDELKRLGGLLDDAPKVSRPDTPPDLLGESLNTGDLDREMRREARLQEILNSPERPDAQELISRIKDSKKQTKQVIKETAIPSATPKPSGGTKNSAQQILDIDNEISRLQKDIDAFENRRYNADTMGDIGSETQAQVDKKINQLKDKIKEQESKKRGLQSPFAQAANPASTPAPPTRASAKPTRDVGTIENELQALVDSGATDTEKVRSLQAELRAAEGATAAQGKAVTPSTQFDIETASPVKLRSEQKRLLDAGDKEGARNIQRKLDERGLTGYMDDATQPLTRDGTLVDATGTRNPAKREPVGDPTRVPSQERLSSKSAFSGNANGQTVRTTRDEGVILNDINANRENPDKLRQLQAELQARRDGYASFVVPTPGAPTKPRPDFVGSGPTKPSVNSYKNVDALIADQNYPLPEGVRTSIKDSGVVAGDVVKQMDSETVNFLRQEGVVVSPDLDPRALSNYAKDTSNVRNLPAGVLLDSNQAGARETMINMGLERGFFEDSKLVRHKASGKIVGSVENGNVVLFDQKRISTEAALEGARNGSVTKLENGAVLKMDDLTAAATQRDRNLSHLKEVKQGGDTFLVNANNGQVIGKKQGGNVVGVDRQEVAMLEQRFEDTQRRELLQSITPEGSNGLYSPEQIQKMGPEQKRLIPFTEGGTGVKTVEDFKMLEQRALDAERLFNEQAGARKLFGNSDESKKAYAELEKTKLDLREQYREARESLIAQYQETATKQMNGTLPDTNAREVEEALKYLQEREVGFFNTTPLKNNTKGYKLPETPGGILGDSAKMGLGIGAAGLGAYALLGGSGSGGSQQDPYAQYGQY